MYTLTRTVLMLMALTTHCTVYAEPAGTTPVQRERTGAQALKAAIAADNLSEVQRLMVHAASLCPPSERHGRKLSEAQKLAAVLKHAASVNAVNTISWVLKQRVNPDDTRWNAYNHHAHDGRTALHTAALHAQPDAVRVLLAAGANPNAIDESGNTPLMLVAEGPGENEARECQTAELLLQAGADPVRRNHAGKNATEITQNSSLRYLLCYSGALDEYGYLDLHSVTFEPHNGNYMRQQLLSGEIGEVESELKAGEDANRQYDYGTTPLLLAVRCGDAEMVRLLLRYGATIPTEPSALYPMLYAAVLSGNPELLSLLPYVEPSVDSAWESPLVVALRGKCGPAMTRALIQLGANADARSHFHHKFSLLQYARMSGDEESATILGAHMASEWSVMDDILKADDVERLRSLLATRCFFAIDRRNPGCRTPLLIAQSAKQQKIAELLLAAGADDKAVVATLPVHPAPRIDDDAAFAAQVATAVQQGDCDFFRSLRQEYVNRLAGAVHCNASAFDPGPAKGRYYQAAPLKHAAAAGKADLVRVLLARGANTEDGDSFSRTPIEYAAANGHVECVRLLLNAGAARYRQALYAAALCAQHEVVNYLLARGVLPGLAAEWALLSESPHPGLLAQRKPDVDIALSLAVQLDHPAAVKRLVAMGANVNRPNFYPLHTTCEPAMVRALAECGADLSRRNAEQLTPLENARKQNYTLAAKELEILTQTTQK